MQLSEAKQALQSLVRRLTGLPPQDRERVEFEFAEILLYLIRAADQLGIDPVVAASKRIAHPAGHPSEAVADPRPPVTAAVPAGERRPRILIVEDERIVAADLQEVLNGLGYDAYAIASSGTEALAIARAKRPDIALMDIRIDGHVDGIEVAAQLRTRFNTAVIFVTALADDAAVQRAKHSYPDAYLIKPVSARALRTTIELTTHRHRQPLTGLRA